MLVLALPHAACALEARTAFDVPAGTAADAITRFAHQAQVNVLAPGERLAGLRTNALRGNYSLAEGLALLLAGTGLTHKLTPGGVIIVAAARAASAQPPVTTDAAPAGKRAAVVLVAGTRQAIATAISQKEAASTVIDAIVAEDVGQFPDKNVGEALSRITGVQVSSDFGEGNQMSIRGVKPDLNRLEINGMSMLSTSEAGTRAPDLRDLPSELIKSIEVVKGVTADLTEGGLGGAVLVRTRRPLDFDRFTLATTLSGERSSLRGGVQPRASLLVADRFLDGRLGLMANLVSDKVLTQADRVRNSGWRFIRDWDLAADKTVTSLDPALAAVSEKIGCAAFSGTRRSACERQWHDYSPNAPRYGILRRDHQRSTGELSAQYRFGKALTAFASVQRYRQLSRLADLNYATDLGSANRLADSACATPAADATPAGVVVTDHHVTEYVVGDCLAQPGRGGSNAFSLEARDFRQQVDHAYLSAGFDWRPGRWQIAGLAGTSTGRYRNDSNYLGLLMNAPGMKVSLDSQGFPHFSFPPQVGPDHLAGYTQARLTYNPVELDTGEDQLKLDLQYRTGHALVKRIAFGVQGRSNGSKRYANGGDTLDGGSDLGDAGDNLDVQSSDVRYTWNYDPMAPAGALRPPVIQPFRDANNREQWVSAEQMRRLVTSLRAASPEFLRGAGLPGFPNNWTGVDFSAVLPFFDTATFNHERVRQAPASDGTMRPQIPALLVKERIRAAYVRLDADFTLFGWPVEGNVGLRYAGTQVSAGGRQRLFARVERTPGGAAYDDRLLATAMVETRHRYHDFLPSANALIWLRPDRLLLRAGYGKVMARPSLEQMDPDISCIIGSGNPQFGGNGVDSCSVGNPGLAPYRAVNTDLSLEWYPGKEQQLSLAVFEKNIATANHGNVVVRADPLGAGSMFDVTTAVNGRGARTRGVELAVRTALTFLPAFLDGLGVDANFTRLGYRYPSGAALVNALDGSELPFPGMSPSAYNLALWYDRGPFNFRMVWNRRAAFYTGSNDINTGNPLFVEAAGFLDMKLQFRLNRRLSLALEAKNLGDEHTLSTAGAPSRPNEYSWSGRRYFFGLNYVQ